jgi:hypothetical protein
MNEAFPFVLFCGLKLRGFCGNDNGRKPCRVYYNQFHVSKTIVTSATIIHFATPTVADSADEDGSSGHCEMSVNGA